MSRSIRRLLACLLILLLPFSAIAGTLAALGNMARHCPPAAIRSADCCKHDSKAHAPAACCVAAAAIAALPTAILPAPPLAPDRAHAGVLVVFYDSFIPDSLHRPPRA